MNRKLTENDRETTLNFLYEEPSFNLFIIGDILNTGFNSDFMEMWGQYDEVGSLTAVLLRYFNNFIPYYKPWYKGDLQYFKDIIVSCDKKKLISGKSEIVDRFTDILKEHKLKRDYFCELRDKSKLVADSGDMVIKKASAGDAGRISDFIECIEELGSTGENREMLAAAIESGAGRYYYIEDEYGNIASVAGTSAETRFSAMVVSVATRKDLRKRGLAVKCVSRLCLETLKDCKNICLFYDNPEAGKVYHGIGFETIGNWTMAVEY